MLPNKHINHKSPHTHTHTRVCTHTNLNISSYNDRIFVGMRINGNVRTHKFRYLTFWFGASNDINIIYFFIKSIQMNLVKCLPFPLRSERFSHSLQKTCAYFLIEISEDKTDFFLSSLPYTFWIANDKKYTIYTSSYSLLSTASSWRVLTFYYLQQLEIETS